MLRGVDSEPGPPPGRRQHYGTRLDAVICTSAALCGSVGPTAFAEQTHPYVQTVRTELVWRF